MLLQITAFLTLPLHELDILGFRGGKQEPTSKAGYQGTRLAIMTLYNPTAACAHCEPILPLVINRLAATTSTACRTAHQWVVLIG